LTAVLEECAKREVLEFMGCMQPSTNMVKPSNHMSNPGTFFGNILD
jgi:hypothetical protein